MKIVYENGNRKIVVIVIHNYDTDWDICVLQISPTTRRMDSASAGKDQRKTEAISVSDSAERARWKVLPARRNAAEAAGGRRGVRGGGRGATA